MQHLRAHMINCLCCGLVFCIGLLALPSSSGIWRMICSVLLGIISALPAVQSWVELSSLPIGPPPPPLPVAKDTKDRFQIMLNLCVRAYDRANRLVEGDKRDGWEYSGNEADLALHLWQRGEGGNKEWVLVIRGTQMAHELFTDWRLITDTLHGSTAFGAYAVEFGQTVRKFLERKSVTSKITFTGHSLGASLAEYLLHTHRAAYPLASAVTFDSPGLSRRFRARHGIPSPLPDLSTLNSTPNPVNTLNPPLAEPGSFFACGSGAAFPLDWVVRPTRWLFGTAWSAVRLLRKAHQNIQTHTLRHIRDHLDADAFQSSRPDHWPRYTGSALESIYTIAKGHPLGETPAQDIAPPPPLPPPPVLLAIQAAPAPEVLNMPPVPDDLTQMEPKLPYRIENGIAAWDSFRDRVAAGGGDDVIIALTGPNSVGKSSVYKALLGHTRPDRRIPIGVKTHTTQFPIVALYGAVNTGQNGQVRQTRIYLVDLPGFGAAGAEGERSDFITDSSVEMVRHIANLVGSVLYVMNTSAPTTELVKYYRTLSHEAGPGGVRVSVRVIYNSYYTGTAARAEGARNLAQALGLTTDQVIMCRALTGADSEGEGNTTDLLREWAGMIHPDRIAQGGANLMARNRPTRAEVAQRANPPANPADMDIPLLPQVVAGAGTVGGTAGMAWGAYVIGLEGWGLLAGPILAGPAGTGAVLASAPIIVAAGPAIAVGVGAAALGYGLIGGTRRFWRWRRS